MKSETSKSALMHYSAPPIVGGVESVLYAHAEVFLKEKYPLAIIAGSGDASALPKGIEFVHLPLLSSNHTRVIKIQQALEEGYIPDDYHTVCSQIKQALLSIVQEYENLFVHNILSKHFNLPLTDAILQLFDEGKIHNLIAWCHDFSWSSSRARVKLHDGNPWDLLRTYRSGIQYVVVSRKRQEILAEILGISRKKIKVVYNGLDSKTLLGIHDESDGLIDATDLENADLIILMPIRITQAKNIEFGMQVTSEIRREGIEIRTILTGPPDPHDPQISGYFRQLKNLRAELQMEKYFHFLCERGSQPEQIYLLDMKTVSDMYRICDLVLMPSHHEGFGMPVIEAGFLGKPIFTTSIPAATEIGVGAIHLINPSKGSKETAHEILNWAAHDRIFQFRQKTRREFTWTNIFRNQIEPLLKTRD